MAVAGAILTGLAVNGISKALGFSAGGEVKKDGLYELHKGELIIPAKEAQLLIKEYKKHKGFPKDMKHRFAKPAKLPKPKKKGS